MGNGPSGPSGPAPGRPGGGSSGGTSTYDLTELEQLERPRRWRRIILIGGAVLLFVAAGTTAFLVGSSSSPPPAASAEYDVTLVANEESDSEALSTDHLFPENVETEGGDTYSLVHSDDVEECAEAGNGNFGAVLEDAECRQVVRGVYVNEDEDTAVTVGVGAFPSDDAAAEVAETQEIDAGEWFVGLSGPEDSPVAELDGAGGQASGLTWGRYHVFALAAGVDGEEQDTDALAELSEEFVTVPFTPLGDRARIDE